jgi:cytochrome oxidase Cu insertion factor (SCO1/SenC/PrrC family)
LTPAPDRRGSVDEAVAQIEALRVSGARDALAGLLDERHPLYRGLGVSHAERLRGYVLAAFEEMGLPPAALPFVLEELESGVTPYNVAAAAKALRGTDSVPNRAQSLLFRAIDRLRGSDDRVCFTRYAPGPAAPDTPTALVELVRTLGHAPCRIDPARLAALASRKGGARFSAPVRAEIEHVRRAMRDRGSPPPLCCHSADPPGRVAALPREAPVALGKVPLQDQSGAAISYGRLFHGRPAVLTFFYTRCMNPEKCSLTVTKLARLKRRLDAEGVAGALTLAGFTYDPDFDIPSRLRAYGADRGLDFDERCRLVRTTAGFEAVAAHFDLGVGYGPVTVNRHRLELFVIDAAGQIVESFLRGQWEEDEVAAAALGACRDPRPAATPVTP